MDKVKEFLEKFEISEEDALIALLGSFGPPQACGTRGYWKRHEHYGFSAPTTAEIRKIYESNDYRCTRCNSQRGLSIDHDNGNSQDHKLKNLVLLCKSCNRGKSSKPTNDMNHKLKIYEAALALFKEKGKFPETKAEIRKKADVGQIGGVTYFLDYMKSRLERNA